MNEEDKKIPEAGNPPAEESKKITYDDFKKVEMKVGEILSVERIPNSEKLLKLSVNFNEEAPRQILSGIAAYVPEIETLVGKKCMFVTNLEPRKMMGLESNGMLLAVGEGETFSFLEPKEGTPPGATAK